MSTTPPPYPDGKGSSVYVHKRGATLGLAAWWNVPPPVSQWTILEAQLRDALEPSRKVGDLAVTIESATPASGKPFNSIVTLRAPASAQASWPVKRKLAFDVRMENVDGDVLYTGTGFIMVEDSVTHG